jgi:hypothetical protein
MSQHVKKKPVALSIGILASDDESGIRDALESLFRQSVFERLCTRHEQCEILVVAHAGTEATIARAREVFDAMELRHTWSDAFSARVIEIPEPGRASAWNRFVHEFSAVEARYICAMDANIAFHHRDTIYNLMAILERKAHVPASTDREINALILKERRTWAERIALGESALIQVDRGKLCERLYCLRAAVARSLFLPRDLAGAETEFINDIVSTEFFTRDANPHRVIVAPEAAHLYAPPVQRRDVVEREKRRAIGRAALHVLLEHLKTLSWEERNNLGDTLHRLEARDPDWLKKMIAVHLRRRPFFWQLFPHALTLRLRQLFALPGVKKLTHLRAMVAATTAMMMACFGARRSLRRSVTQYLTPAKQPGIVNVPHLGVK